MSAVETISFKGPRPRDGIGLVNEGSDIPKMKPRRGRMSGDKHMVKLLCEALDDLAETNCSFWACEGPSKPRHMVTCVKCWAMRNVATVAATLEALMTASTPPQDPAEPAR